MARRAGRRPCYFQWIRESSSIAFAIRLAALANFAASLAISSARSHPERPLIAPPRASFHGTGSPRGPDPA